MRRSPSAGRPARVRAGRETLSGDPVTGLALLRRRLAFGTATRAEVWQLLGDVLASDVDLEEALDARIKGYLITGRKSRAHVLAEMRAGALDNAASERLSRYTSPPERLILEGLGQQEASAVFTSAARLLRNRLALRKALHEAIAMPILLVAGLIGIVLFFGLELLPALAEVIDFDRLGGVQGLIVQGTLMFSANPARLALILAGLIVALILMMRLWTGPGRAFADRFPPFSVMKLQAGTGFLFAVIEYGRNGTAVTPALLERMAGVTGRYEASRIRALIGPMQADDNLGAAALAAGQGFPDDEIAVDLSLLWGRKDGIERAGDFLQRRLAQIESTVKTRMAMLNVTLMVSVAGALLMLMSIALPIVEQINSSMGGM